MVMPPDLVVSLVAVTLSVGLLSGMLAWSVLHRYAPARRRLRQLAVQTPASAWRQPLGLTEEPNELAERICRLVPRSPKRMGEMRARLVAAGYRSQAAP